MDSMKILDGKRVLVVDDERDVLEAITSVLHMCKIDTASSFEGGKKLLEKETYDIAILDIMGVKGFELLEIANQRKVPALMLTAHALSEANLLKSAQNGASYYAPKEQLWRLVIFVADVLEAKEKNKNIWARWLERLGDFYDKRFHGTKWREEEKEFWERKVRQSGF